MADAERVTALTLEVARLKRAVRAALALERFWRVRALLAPRLQTSRHDVPRGPHGGGRQRAQRRRGDPR